MLLLIILTSLLIISFFLYYIFFRLNDVSLKNFNVKNLLTQKGNILFIYPHPDDETMISGSLISQLAKVNTKKIFVINLTHGEHGDELIKVSPKELSQIRKEEFAAAMKELGVKNFELWNFEDGSISLQEEKYSKYLKEFIQNNKIKTIFTYEKGGVYAHPDHISLSKVASNLKDELNIRVLYATLPQKILEMAGLPKTINIKGKVIDLEKLGHDTPTHKFFSFEGNIAKVKAASKYKSQKLTPGGLPLWLEFTLIPFEYFFEEEKLSSLPS